ncbi:MAG: radical SAM protein [Chitinispirillaceae bacterium]|nr:radical SAM protein [Chitinispirillaceae bacterium]
MSSTTLAEPGKMLFSPKSPLNPVAAPGSSLSRVSPAVPLMTDAVMRSRLDRGILSFFFDALKVALPRPAWWRIALRLFLAQRAAAKKRASWLPQNVQVPPFMVLSVTNRCNLRCAGCYAKALHHKKAPELSGDRLSELLLEALGLGVSSVLIAGGEPLTRTDLLDITARFPGITFPLFTNGILLDAAIARRLRKQRNVIPVLSIEGNRLETDDRRGEGVFAQVEASMAVARKHGLFFGCSVTVTRSNFDLVMSDDWIRRFCKAGCRLFVFVEYVPVAEGSNALVLSQEQRLFLIDKAGTSRKTFRSLFLAFPGDEDQFGGCLAAGRGFIHISPSGDLEPCPFAPYADRNVAETSLKRALGSPLLKKIRENHGALQETAGGCSLWAEREWVASIAGQDIMN